MLVDQFFLIVVETTNQIPIGWMIWSFFSWMPFRRNDCQYCFGIVGWGRKACGQLVRWMRLDEHTGHII